MKKLSIILLISILACLFITSCNSDAEHGLYQQISTSSKISSIKISDLLLVDGSNYYYYNDTGIFKFDGTNHKALVTNSQDIIVRGAYAKSETEIFFIDASGQLYFFDGTKSEPINTDITYSVLFSNGYIKVKSGKLFYITSKENISEISSGNTSEEKIYSTYISFKDGSTYYLFQGTVNKEVLSGPHMGFVVADDGTVYLIQSNGLYKAAGTEKLVEFKNSKQENGQIPAFALDKKIYLKFGNEFVVYDTATKKEAEVTKGWALNIATASMIDFKFDNYITTYQNGLFKIDITNNQNTRIF